MNLQIARVLGAATVVAVLWLAPSAASAHMGHAHAPAAPAIQETIAPASQILQAEELTAASTVPSMPSDDADCNGRGCCSNGPCTGCLGFLPVTLPITGPLLSSSSLVIGDAPPRASPHNGRLRRPPKSFV